MMRIPVILAGVAAALILMRITARKPKKFAENMVSEGSTKSIAADTTRSIELEKDEPEEIIQVKRIRVHEKLEAKYPGLKNFTVKKTDKVTVK